MNKLKFDLSIINNANIPTYDKAFIVSLYNDYIKNQENSNDVNLIKIRGAYNEIEKKIKNIDDKEYLNFIQNKYLILKNYIDSFDIKNKDSVVMTVNMITKLESLLKLSITFPASLERCLEEEFQNIENKVGEKDGRIVKRIKK